MKGGGVVNSLLSSIIAWGNLRFMNIRRKTMLTLSQVVKDMKLHRPPEKRIARPITALIIKVITEKQPRDNWETLNYRSALEVSYGHLLRSGEYTCDSKHLKHDRGNV